jgi:site-specific DNA-cytosine methylase
MNKENASGIIIPDNNQLICASFFHGVGGMSMGAKRAGFDSIYCTDLEPTTEAAFHLNNNSGVFQRADIMDLNFESVQELLRIESNYILKKGEMDLILSGSPCPGMSALSRLRHWLNDTNHLMHTQTRLACGDGFNTKVAWFEQVPGFMDNQMTKLRREVEARLRAQSDYYYDIKVLDAADYGATQSRKRVTIIMVRKDIGEPSFPKKQQVDYSKVSVHNLLPDIVEFRQNNRKPGKSSYDTLCCTLVATGQEEVREAGNPWRKMTNHERMILSGIASINLDGISETKKKRLFGNMVQPAFAEAICRHIREQILKR